MIGRGRRIWEGCRQSAGALRESEATFRTVVDSLTHQQTSEAMDEVSDRSNEMSSGERRRGVVSGVARHVATGAR
jgi:hypothetical protein